MNPVVTPIGSETETDSEGCLSLGSVRVQVERLARVKLEARDAAGEPVSLELEGYPGPGRAARGRPPRRQADARAHRRRSRAARRSGRCDPASFSRRAMARIAVAATAPYRRGRPGAPRGEARRVARSSPVPTRPPAAAGGRPRLRRRTTAERLGIPVLQPDRPTAGLDLGAETVVVCAYGLLIPTDLLDERLWLNVHPSLLPRWRGAAPVERAMMAGDDETGVTIHETVAELDAGPIAAREAFPIGDEDDAGAVFERAAEVAARLLDDVLARSSPTFEPQAGEPTLRREARPRRPAARSRRDPPPSSCASCAHSARTSARAPTSTGRRVTVWRARVGPDGGFEPLEVQPEGRQADGRRRLAARAAVSDDLARAPRRLHGRAARLRGGRLRRSRAALRVGRARRPGPRARAEARLRDDPAHPRARPRDRDARATARPQARPAGARRAPPRRVPAGLPRRRTAVRSRQRVRRARPPTRGSSGPSPSRTPSCGSSPTVLAASSRACRRRRRARRPCGTRTRTGSPRRGGGSSAPTRRGS